MIERLVDLIMRLKAIFATQAVTNSGVGTHGRELAAMEAKIDSLMAEQNEAIKLLDELEEVIKKWES